MDHVDEQQLQQLCQRFYASSYICQLFDNQISVPFASPDDNLEAQCEALLGSMGLQMAATACFKNAFLNRAVDVDEWGIVPTAYIAAIAQSQGYRVDIALNNREAYRWQRRTRYPLARTALLQPLARLNRAGGIQCLGGTQATRSGPLSEWYLIDDKDFILVARASDFSPENSQYMGKKRLASLQRRLSSNRFEG